MKLFCLGLVAAGGLLALSCSDDSGETSGSGGTGGRAGGSVAGSGGGPGGSGGAVSVLPPATFPFTDSTDGFALDTFANSGPFTDGNPQNIGGVPNGTTTPVVAFDSHEGMPDDGSVRITATFNDFNQTVTVRRVYPPNQTIDLTGKTVTAQIKLDSGTFTGIVHLMTLSTPSPPNPAPGYYFAQGDSITLTDHDWHTLRFQMAAPEFAATGWVPGDIVQIGVQLASGLSAGGAAGSGGGAGAAGSGGGAGAAGSAGGAGGAAGGAGMAGAGGGTAITATTSAYGSPQSITIHFDTMSWN